MKITDITRIGHHDSQEKYDSLKYDNDTGMYTCVYRELHSRMQYNIIMNPSEALWLTEESLELKFVYRQRFIDAFTVALNEYIKENLLRKEG